jgi:serine/threonine-protein kinase
MTDPIDSGDEGQPATQRRPETLVSSVGVDAYIGRTIDGRYLVESVLGEGGMGVVYQGRHKVIDKKVAIKVLRGEMARNKEITERFLQEARSASSIGNPHIIDISDFGTLPDGSTYFVMEFLGGKSLTDAIAEVRPMPLARILSIGQQIAAGLAAAHEAGIVHRDLKPDNVMLIQRSTPGSSSSGRDFVKILDFGIAKVSGEASRLTQAGSIFGTPHYMSPEQAAGTTVDLRTDIYALGIILYEMASGKVPFDADNFMGILTQHMYKAPVPILALVPAPEIPPGLDAVIQKCLSKKVDGRYSSMTELATDLEKVGRGEHPDALAEMMARSGAFALPSDYFRASAMPAPVPASPPVGARRGRTPMLIAMGVVATIGIAVVATLTRSQTSTAQGTATPPAAVTVVAPIPDVKTAPTSTEPAAPMTMTVTIAVTPKGAKVIRTGSTANLNTPVGGTAATGVVELQVIPGSPVPVEVSAPGYKTSKLNVDGTTQVLRVDLEFQAAKPVPPGPPKPKKRCNPGDELCNPFE